MAGSFFSQARANPVSPILSHHHDAVVIPPRAWSFAATCVVTLKIELDCVPTLSRWQSWNDVRAAIDTFRVAHVHGISMLKVGMPTKTCVFAEYFKILSPPPILKSLSRRHVFVPECQGGRGCGYSAIPHALEQTWKVGALRTLIPPTMCEIPPLFLASDSCWRL